MSDAELRKIHTALLAEPDNVSLQHKYRSATARAGTPIAFRWLKKGDLVKAFDSAMFCYQTSYVTRIFLPYENAGLTILTRRPHVYQNRYVGKKFTPDLSNGFRDGLPIPFCDCYTLELDRNPNPHPEPECGELAIWHFVECF